MSDYEPQPDLDDELLSAYLDDELSSADRAAVETRLAEDPTARQLLHHLRAVSEAVQALPQEVVGHDMRESILQRAEPATYSAAGEQPPTAGEPLDTSNGQPAASAQVAPKFTIGRTRRAWVWASFAVAAALLIMAFQPGPDGDNLPAVALRDKQAATEKDEAATANARRRDLVVRELNETAAPAGAPEATQQSEDLSLAYRTPESGIAGEPTANSGPPPTSAGVEGVEDYVELAPRAEQSEPADEADRAVAANLNAPASASAPSGGESLEERVEMPAADGLAAAAPAPKLRRIAPNAGFGDTATGETAPPADKEQPVEEPIVVVRVLAKRSAVERKTFDRLLERNGIEVDSAADDLGEVQVQEEARSARRFAEIGQSGPAVEPGRNQANDPNATVDAVLVEAVPAAIEACLDGLNKDDENFPGLDVDDSAVASLAGADFDADVMAKQKLANDLGLTKFNRGTVPQESESITRAKDYSFGTDGAYFAGGGLGGRSRAESESQTVQQQHLWRARKSLTESNKGLAVRLPRWGRDGREPQQPSARGGLTTNGETAASSLKLGAAARGLSEVADQVSEGKLQVLFLFSCEDDPAASSPPAQDEAQ
jgi:hypothetical protein